MITGANMESGTAYFSNELGLIDTLRPPSPVNFAPTSFPNVGPGPVLFRRVPGLPDEAADVRNAWQTESLLAIAGQAHRLTHPARALLQARTAEVVQKYANEGDSTRAYTFQKEAERTWAKVATLQANGKVRVGVKAVREALDTLALNEPTSAPETTRRHE
jgi:hypothetical protein